MSVVFLSIGSNIQPEKHIPRAIAALKETFQVLQVSSVYETDPVGPAGDQKFWNLAVCLETKLGRVDLQTKIREIETALGRIRSAHRFAPRTIDIDILPQKDYQTMGFIMIPLAEIAPLEKDPETEKTFEELAVPLKQEAKNFRRVA